VHEEQHDQYFASAAALVATGIHQTSAYRWTRPAFEKAPSRRRRGIVSGYQGGRVMSMKALFIGFAILLTGCTTENMMLEHTKSSIGKAMVLHAKGIPCPPGYKLVKGFFHEKNGSTQDAYVSEKQLKEGYSIDYLAPGESVGMLVPLPPGALERKPIVLAPLAKPMERI
jgi:hypothetical protein